MLIRTGEEGRQPCKVGVAATDIATGLYAHGAIMAALISRNKTGKGVRIDCNLFESQVCEHITLYSNAVNSQWLFTSKDSRFGEHRVKLLNCRSGGISTRDRPPIYCSIRSVRM